MTNFGVTFNQLLITLPDNVSISGSHSVVIDKDSRIRVTFYPGAVDVCWNLFQEKKETIPFEFEKPRNALSTKRVEKQWYCLLDENGWNAYREALVTLTKNVDDAWRARKRGETEA